tara:strand:- start:450 stop:659 length:210 start_codon:yes stop_codon:yes gene_type:complete
MESIRVGDNVRFLGYTKEQVNWGSNDTPYMLILDRVYTVSDVEVHRQHTKVQIKGVLGKFNSVHFQVID